MRNKYPDEDILKYVKTHTKEQLLKHLKRKYNLDVSKHQIECYLSSRHIHCKDYCEAKSRNMGEKYPTYAEYTKPDGMVLVKVAHNKCEYKQRYIYEQYHNVSLPTSTMVIFLDGDRTNFDINNLMAVDTREYNCCKNRHLIYKDGELTKTALLQARLEYKIKDVKNESNTR